MSTIAEATCHLRDISEEILEREREARYTRDLKMLRYFRYYLEGLDLAYQAGVRGWLTEISTTSPSKEGLT